MPASGCRQGQGEADLATTWPRIIQRDCETFPWPLILGVLACESHCHLKDLNKVGLREERQPYFGRFQNNHDEGIEKTLSLLQNKGAELSRMSGSSGQVQSLERCWASIEDSWRRAPLGGTLGSMLMGGSMLMRGSPVIIPSTAAAQSFPSCVLLQRLHQV